MRLLLFLAALPLMAQNYTGDVVYTFTSNVSQTTSGGSVVFSWSSGNWCPVGTCTLDLITYSHAGKSVVNETVANCSGCLTLNPTQASIYFLRLQCPSCASGGTNTGILQGHILWIAIGAGASGSITQLLTATATSSSTVGPGIPSVSPVGQMVEMTFSDTAPGCSTFVGGGLVPVGCSGNVSNPALDAWGYCTWTGALGESYTTHSFYSGGAPSGNGNYWKVRFTPPVADTWSTACIFTDPGNYKTFTNSNLFTSVSDPNFHGVLRINPSFPTEFQTADGAPFYPLGVNAQCTPYLGDGNGGCINLAKGETIGEGPSPLNGSTVNAGGAFGNSIGAYLNAGVNFFSIQDDSTQNFLTDNTSSGSLNLTFGYYGVGLSNGFVKTTGGLALDSGLRTVQGLRSHSLMTCEYAPGNTYFNTIANGNPFTNPNATFLWFLGLQYCIDRFGSLTDGYIFGNETGFTQPIIDSSSLWMKQQDPYGRLVSVSVSSGNGTYSAGPNIDINNSHRSFSSVTGSTPTVAAISGAAGTGTILSCQAASSFCNTPVVFGEIQTSVPELPPANLQTRSTIWAAFFDGFATSMIYPSGISSGAGSFYGTPQFSQVAKFSSFVQNFPASATQLLPSFSGQSCGGCTLSVAAMGSAAEIGGYVWNATSTVAVATASITLVWPRANMNCNTFSPLTGAIISSFTGPSSTGSHAVTLPTITSSGVYYPDIVFACWSPATPVITTVMLRDGSLTPATTYSQTVVAQGGTGPYTYRVTQGSLPPGLALNATTGNISGTATTSGFWHFTIVGTDSTSTQTLPQNFILPVMPLPTMGNTTLDNVPIGYSLHSPNSQSVVVGGCQPVAASLSGTLNGTLAYVTGAMAFTGIASSAATLTMTPSVTDACGNTLSGSPTVTAIIPSPTIASNVVMQTASVPAITQGYLYSIQVIARQNSGTTTIANTSGSLPTGLTIQNSGSSESGNTVFQLAGIVSGTTQTASIAPTDTSGLGLAQSYVFTVNSAPSITTGSLPAYSSTAPYLATINTTGGSQPNWCELSPGSAQLPAGFYLDPVINTLYGPPLGGTTAYSISISCWDLNHAGATTAFTISPSPGMPTSSSYGGSISNGGSSIK